MVKCSSRLKTIGEIIREQRENKGLLLKEVATALDVDLSLLSRIERGAKRPTRNHISKLSQILQIDERELVVAYLSDRLVYEIRDEELAPEALKMAEQKIKYLKRPNDIF
jgi:HTH-type transcriptional regulator, competence development regulator